MPVKHTSRAAYYSVLQDLQGLRREVWEAIRAWDEKLHGPGPSIEDLARILDRKESSICARVNELKGYRKDGYHEDLRCILEGPMKLNTSGKSAMTYIALDYREEVFIETATPDGEFEFSSSVRDD